MNISCKKNNVYVIDTTARAFQSAGIVSHYFIIRDLSGGLAAEGAFRLSDIYTCLYHDTIRCLIFVVTGVPAYSVRLFYREETEYREMRDMIKHHPDVPVSRQNSRIGSYSRNLVQLLQNGSRPLIVDAVDESAVLKCPECGTQYEPGQQWCFECGAELPKA